LSAKHWRIKQNIIYWVMFFLWSLSVVKQKTVSFFSVYQIALFSWRRKDFWLLKSRWEDNIKMALREVGWGGMDWINLAQDRDRWRALVNAGNFLSSSGRFSFSGRTLLHGVSKYLFRNYKTKNVRRNKWLQLSYIPWERDE
jgi:hypothetical protein